MSGMPSGGQMSELSEREQELEWFGITVRLSDRRIPYGPDRIQLVPAEVSFDTSDRGDGERTGVTFTVMPEAGETDAETRRRALHEARELSRLFQQLTDPVPDEAQRR